MKPSTKQSGYYVHGRYFGVRLAQATARAAHLSREYGRKISVDTVGLLPPIASNKTSNELLLEGT